jgi:integrase
VKKIKAHIQNKVVDIKNGNNYEFITIPIWINWGKTYDSKEIKRQTMAIAIREINTGVHTIHPVSSFILSWRWRTREYNTKRKHATNIVKFLNYLLENKKHTIKSLVDLDITTGNDYLNSLTNDHRKRGTITDASRTLTSFYVWLSHHNCLPNVSASLIDSRKKKNPHNGFTYHESLFNPILPQHTRSNRKHLLPVKYIPLLLEISILFAHPIALGLYLQIFGGLRAGEVINLKRTQFRKKLNSSDFLLNIKEQQFRTDIKDSSGSNYVKKIRKQQILQIKDWGNVLFKDHVEFYKDLDLNGTGALFINRDGKPMTGKSYSQYFYKIKNKFIEILRDYGSVEDKVVATDVRLSDWGTHIGRGTFTNLIAEEIENPAELMFLRGDSDLISSLPYLAKTERVRKKVEERMNHLHTDYIPRLINRQKLEE